MATGIFCPDCGAPMVMRTARRGPRSGQKFYGCSKYPECKGTRDRRAKSTSKEKHSSPGPDRVQVQSPSDPVPALEQPPPTVATPVAEIPRVVDIAPTLRGRRVQALECAAAPRAAVEALAHAEAEGEVRRALSQWSLELPPRRVSTTQPGTPPWLAVVEKILQRGRLTCLSQDLESELRDAAGLGREMPGGFAPEHLRSAAAMRTQTPVPESSLEDQAVFGSAEESMFFHSLLPELGGPELQSWVVPQVSAGGLSGVPEHIETGQRVDFLIAHPSGPRLVVEIDGSQHREQVAIDQVRDRTLESAGFDVLRIPVQELRERTGPSLKRLSAFLSLVPAPQQRVPNEEVLLARACKRAHQLQLCLLHAIHEGLLDAGGGPGIRWEIHIVGDATITEIGDEQFARRCVADLFDLMSSVAAMYDRTWGAPHLELVERKAASVIVDFAALTPPDHHTILARDLYLPVALAAPLRASDPLVAATEVEEPCRRLLRRVFGFENFREGQFEAIERALCNKDAIVLLPTGSGKSVAFQLAALLRPGLCLVVDPILSLIDDQIENLRAFGIDRAVAITGDIDFETRKALLALLTGGEYLFCYVAPERFQSVQFRQSLRGLTVHSPVATVAIDEAHCVSEWGHDFRPAYLNLARIAREYCASHRVIPPLLALTGTASRAVLKDIQRELEIDEFDAIITPKRFDRPELSYEMIACRSGEKEAALRGVLHKNAQHFGHGVASFFEPAGVSTMAGLVFCPWVNGEYGVVAVSDQLASQSGRSVPFYSGKAPRGFDKRRWKSEKREIATSFKRNQVAVMACTHAFGMGIDKPNIRYTIHYNLPPSIESFYQEAGRAGRDGNHAHCAVLYSDDYPDRNAHLLAPATPIEEVSGQVDKRERESDDDIARLLWFHANSFKGIDIEMHRLRDLLTELDEPERARRVLVTFVEKERLPKERSVHRLLTIGVLDDYTIDYSGKVFELSLSGARQERILECLHRYVASYQQARADAVLVAARSALGSPHRQFVLQVVEELLRFVYDVIERSRRRAVTEMLSLCVNARTDRDIRQRIEDYLGSSAYSDHLDRVVDAEQGGLHLVEEVLEEVRSSLDAGELRGQVARLLEAYPDHPGLLLIRSLAEAMTTRPREAELKANLQAAVQFATSKYGVDDDTISNVCIGAIGRACRAQPVLGRYIVACLIAVAPDRRMVDREVLRRLPPAFTQAAITDLVTSMSATVDRLLKR